MVLPPKFDPLAPEAMEDPYPIYDRLRRSGRLCRGGPAQWVVTRHADIAALIADDRLSSEYAPEYHRIALGDGALRRFFGRIVLNRDPPAHTELRQALAPAFHRSAIRAEQVWISGLVDELLATPLATGRFDAVSDLARQLPIRVLCRRIGLDSADLDQVGAWAAALAGAFATYLPEQERPAAEDAVEQLEALVRWQLQERRRAPRHDLLTRLALDGLHLDPADVVANVVFLLFAGFSTTTDLLATGCALLASHPEQFARLRRDRSLIGPAVEEMLRIDAPVQVKSRRVRESMEIGDRTVRPGRILVLLLGSANRDPAVFERADRFDIGRRPNPHLSFGGGGPHHCLGAGLARLEARTFFGRLVELVERLEPAGEAHRDPSPSFRSYASVPLAIEPAGSALPATGGRS